MKTIKELLPNQIFVFGSNLAGVHGAGAAKQAMMKFGAIYGHGQGLQGQSYAIPTKDFRIKTLPLSEIAKYVQKFIEFAINHPDLEFLVTPIGTGLAGYTIEQIKPLFDSANGITNIKLPHEFEHYNILR